MIVEAAVLIVGDDEQRARPCRRAHQLQDYVPEKRLTVADVARRMIVLAISAALGAPVAFGSTKVTGFSTVLVLEKNSLVGRMRAKSIRWQSKERKKLMSPS